MDCSDRPAQLTQLDHFWSRIRNMSQWPKHALLHQLADHNKEIEGTKNELENSYGAININLEDGSYTELSKEDVTKMKVVENVE